MWSPIAAIHREHCKDCNQGTSYKSAILLDPGKFKISSLAMSGWRFPGNSFHQLFNLPYVILPSTNPWNLTILPLPGSSLASTFYFKRLRSTPSSAFSISQQGGGEGWWNCTLPQACLMFWGSCLISGTINSYQNCSPNSSWVSAAVIHHSSLSHSVLILLCLACSITDWSARSN